MTTQEREGWSFNDPTGPGDLFKAGENLGRLIAFVEPKATETRTQYGDTEAAQCSYIVILDGEEAGSVYENSLVFGNLARDVYGRGDSKVTLGRIGQAAAKPGQNPAFILEEATPAEKDAASRWFGEHAETNVLGRIVIN